MSQAPRRLMQSVSIEISPGELIDRITILEIKRAKVRAPDKLKNIERELKVAIAARDSAIGVSERVNALSDDLRRVNEELWEIEDAIRDCERRKTFDAKFIELARRVYITNDRRASIKREISSVLGSELIEEKSYTSY